MSAQSREELSAAVGTVVGVVFILLLLIVVAGMCLSILQLAAVD